MRTVFAVYILVFLATAAWLDAMDRAYIAPEKQMSWGIAAAVAMMWPMSVPVALLGIAYKSNRWGIE